MLNSNLKYVKAAMTVLALIANPIAVVAQCPEEPPLQNFTGGGTVACPCFVPNEQAGAVLTAPAGHYPLEILRIGVGWGSLYGGNPAQIEQAIHVYAGGFPIRACRSLRFSGPNWSTASSTSSTSNRFQTKSPWTADRSPSLSNS